MSQVARRGLARWLPILSGAAVAAAFLGPGTVTTAARAGASFGYGLLWALAVATVACFVLQDAVARLTVADDRPLAAQLRHQVGTGVAAAVAGAVVLGCAAYEAGNILGGVAGAELAAGVGRRVATVATVTAAFLVLWFGSGRGRRDSSGRLLGVLTVLVATMGTAFAVTAVGLRPEIAAVLRGAFVPSMPEGSTLLVLGLVGTTVVPYNLFLGSGLARGQDPAAARWGLALAIGLGGLVSMAVLVVGAAVAGPFGFDAVAAVLADRLGPWAVAFFGWGLFAAGFTSAITAPLAAAHTARGLFAGDRDDLSWSTSGARFRGTWCAVLAVGAVFGLTEVKPVPMILLAQAANGLVLPLVAVFVAWTVHRRRLGGDTVGARCGRVVLVSVALLTVILGARGLWSAISAVT